MSTTNQKTARFRLGKKFTLVQIDEVQDQLKRITHSLESAKMMIEASTDAADIENRVRFIMDDLEKIVFRPSKFLNAVTTFNQLAPFEITEKEKEL